MTPSRSVRTSSIAARLAGSAHASLFAMSRVVDVRIVSMILSPLRRSVDPVSVRSTSASIISGTLASVAPYEKWTSTSMPRSSKNCLVTTGNSVVIRLPGAISRAEETAESSGTASTIRTKPVPVLAYGSSATSITSAPLSRTQSWPDMPISKKPSCTNTGISCGRSTFARSIRGSSTVGLYARLDFPMVISASLSNRIVCSSSEPFGKASDSMGDLLGQVVNVCHITLLRWSSRGKHAMMACNAGGALRTSLRLRRLAGS
jgi:hypothetical protein